MTEQLFIPVGSLGESFGHDAHALPPTGALAGRRLDLRFDGHDVVLAIGEGIASFGAAVDVPVRVTSIRPGLFLVDGLVATESTTFVLDLDAGLVTRVTGRLPDAVTRSESAYERVQRGVDPTGVTVGFAFGTIDCASPLHRHGPSDALVGLRNRYTYSPTEAYEHIYLTPDLYTWHCLSGAERGLADTDRCHHVAIRDRLTLFVWREKIVPTLGLVLIDLDGMTTDGKIFGNDGFDAASIANFPVGARAEILNHTRYGAS